MMLYKISRIVTLVTGTLALVATITLVEAQCDEQADITGSKLDCLVRLATEPKAAGEAGSEMMIIDDTARCSLRPVTNDEPVVLMVRMRHSLVYFSMPNMDACLDTSWQFEDVISMVSPMVSPASSLSGGIIFDVGHVRLPHQVSERVFCGEIRGNKFVDVRPAVLVVWMTCEPRRMRDCVLSRSGRPMFVVPMPDAATCEEAIAQTRNELNPANVYCSLVPSKRPRRLVESLPSGRVRAGEPFAAVLVVWMGRGQALVAMRTMAECERAAPLFPMFNDRVAEAFCRPSELEDFDANHRRRLQDLRMQFNDDMLNPKLRR
jgi:hypothetical protein